MADQSPVVTPTSSQTPSIFNTAAGNTSNFNTGPKLSIKLDDKNFLIWNQQVEGVIATHKLHQLLVNPSIPPQFDFTEDQNNDKVSEAYDQWFVQDQALFTWLLSTFSDSVLPRVLNCRHAYQVWDTIHKHFYAHLKAKMCQLRAELKTTKKGNRSITEYIARIRALANSLIAIGDAVSEQDLVDIVLDGLLEEYGTLVMLAHNPILHARTKHLELDIHFVREKVAAKKLVIQHVPGTLQLADSLTMPLSAAAFLEQRFKLKVVHCTHPPSSLKGE